MSYCDSLRNAALTLFKDKFEQKAVNGWMKNDFMFVFYTNKSNIRYKKNIFV